jgi:hypothetical protein
MLKACVDQAYRLRCKLNVYRTAGLAEARRYDPLRLHSVSPDSLTREVPGAKLRSEHTPGEVVGGDWDLVTGDFERSIHYRGFRERFVDGCPWQETTLYRDAVNRPPGKYWHRCRTAREVLEALREYDVIFESIAKHGYLTQRELAARRPRWRIRLTPPELGEILVHIARDGSYLFDDGRHRLSIVKILGLKEVPALVLLRHRLWYHASSGHAPIATIRNRPSSDRELRSADLKKWKTSDLDIGKGAANVERRDWR